MLDLDNYIFDLDGTLIDTAPRILECLQLSLKKNGISINNKIFNSSLISPKLSDILENMGIDNKLKNIIIMDFRTEYNQNPCLNTAPFPDVEDYLKSLKTKNKRIFVATNKPIFPTKKLLEMLKDIQFDDIMTPDKFEGKSLNKIQMVNYLIERYDLNPLKTAVIGDTETDEEAAHKNKCLSVFFAGGYGRSKNSVKTFYKYGDLL